MHLRKLKRLLEAVKQLGTVFQQKWSEQMEVQPGWILERWSSGTRKGISEEVVSQRRSFMFRVNCLAATTLSPQYDNHLGGKKANSIRGSSNALLWILAGSS